MESFTPLRGFLAGVLIGLAATFLLLANGRIAGISGIRGGGSYPDGAQARTKRLQYDPSRF